MNHDQMCLWCRTYLEEELMKARSKEIMRKVNPIKVWYVVERPFVQCVVTTVCLWILWM